MKFIKLQFNDIKNNNEIYSIRLVNTGRWAKVLLVEGTVLKVLC